MDTERERDKGRKLVRLEKDTRVKTKREMNGTFRVTPAKNVCPVRILQLEARKNFNKNASSGAARDSRPLSLSACPNRTNKIVTPKEQCNGTRKITRL